jgi:hypothetical protein
MSCTVNIEVLKQEHAPHKAQFNRYGMPKFPLKAAQPIHECVLHKPEKNNA